MGSTRKISFFVDYPNTIKDVSELLGEIRRLINDTRANYTDLEGFALSNIGLCRLKKGIRVNLYFEEEEKRAYTENEQRVKI